MFGGIDRKKINWFSNYWLWQMYRLWSMFWFLS